LGHRGKKKRIEKYCIVRNISYYTILFNPFFLTLNCFLTLSSMNSRDSGHPTQQKKDLFDFVKSCSGKLIHFISKLPNEFRKAVF
jgi:hypothetical protein